MKRLNKIKDKLTTALLWLIAIVLVLILLAYCGFNIWLWIEYGSKPITEIPAWALDFMFWMKR